MFRQRSWSSNRFMSRPVVLLFICFVITAYSKPRGQTDDYKAQRAAAIQLCETNKMVDALPILEKLHATNPEDTIVLERLSQALVNVALVQKNAESRKQMFIRARKLADQAKELGDESSLLKILLTVPADGLVADSGFSTNEEANTAMTAAESAFAKGDMEQALAGYKRALELDPKLYEAALYAGDAAAKLQPSGDAGIWYAKAIAIDPERETAYRYWGDTLTKAGKHGEGRIKLIEAYVADPYSKYTGRTLSDWARVAQVKLQVPQIKVPKVDIKENEKGGLTLNLNTGDLSKGPDPWFVYSLSKTIWRSGDRFKKAYPNEKEYRHSLAEEVEGLGMVADSAAEQLKSGKIKQLDESLTALVKLKEQGLLEPYILFFLADDGVATEYKTYRAQHRDKLIQLAKQMVPEPK